MKRCTVDAFGREDNFIEADIQFTVSGASGVLTLTFLDDLGEWKANVAYPPGGWRSMSLRFMDETERDEVEPQERTLDAESSELESDTQPVVTSTRKERVHGE